MTPLIANLGPTELIIILAIVLLIFGGSRLAGLGKSTGRAIREFKEETKDVRSEPRSVADSDAADTSRTSGIHDAEVIDPETKKDH